MRAWIVILGATVLCAGLSLGAQSAPADEPQRETGEQLDPATYGPAVIESIADVLERDARERPQRIKARQGRPGTWAVPGKRATSNPRSGEHYAVNKWGDTRMGIGFPQLVDVHGAYFGEHTNAAVTTTGVRVIGYRDGQGIAQTDWLTGLSPTPKWFPLNLVGVDRIEIQAQPVIDGAGWYGLDDLTYSVHSDVAAVAREMVVVDFEDLPYRTLLTDSGYAGLTWETGRGDFNPIRAVPEEVRELDEDEPSGSPQPLPPLPTGTAPILERIYDAVQMGDEGQYSIPPDTCGAVGEVYYTEAVNSVFLVYYKGWPGWPVVSSSLQSFLNMPEEGGDPRIIFDPHSQRWIVMATGFYFPEGDPEKRIYIAVSSSTDPSDDWFKTDFVANQGTDSSYWPDYPTLGVDENGIYIACSMIGRNAMTIFAIDKAPLVAETQSLGDDHGLAWQAARWGDSTGVHARQPGRGVSDLTPEFGDPAAAAD